MKFRASSKELFRKTAVIVEICEKMPKKYRNKTLQDVVPADYWDFIPRDDQQPECYSPSNRRGSNTCPGWGRAYTSHVHYLLRDIPLAFVEQFVSRGDSLFLNCFLVTPNSHRVFEVFHGFTNEPKLMFLYAENLPGTDPAYSALGSKWFKELVMAKHSHHKLNSWNWDKLSACCDLRLFEKGEIFVRRKGNLVRLHHVNELQMGDTIFRIELWELVALDKQLINGQNGQNLLSPCQDSLTAAYLVMKEDILLNKYQMQQFVMFCPHRSQMPTIVRGHSLNSCAWTGKQLFSMLLPPVDYDVPGHDHCQGGSLDFLYTAQEILCEWLSMRGLTISLADICLASESNCWENMMCEASCGLDEAEETLYQYGRKDNSFLTMMKAGSQGNPQKLAQQSMCLGFAAFASSIVFRNPLGLLICLNPFECFVHSVTNRDSFFSEHAEVPGTLTRRLMYFMRDLYLSYDGNVRNAYGNQIVEFSYDMVKETSVADRSVEACISEATLDYDAMGGKPVGSLSGCALSEAAYRALDQPKVLECGVRKAPAEQSASLHLSKNLRLLLSKVLHYICLRIWEESYMDLSMEL
ncbi:RNA polymerase Rpb1, domain 3 [Dillenia turbinata]|uniref:DNA-directed RNA polymerase n=1 Tax=Dillenia turbinata TaxID=194707 RepID=A0AAN8WGS8_9MAGN